MNINAIIECLDNYMLQRKMKQIGAVEANAILEENGLLRDNCQRPGKPLRNLLRAGRLPHAYQHGRNWIIPISGKNTAKIINAEMLKPVVHMTSEAIHSATGSLPPVMGNNPSILVLGTMPGTESLRKREYYAKSGNRFWDLIARLGGEELPNSYEDKIKLLDKCGIALWDVLASAKRAGSSDESITNEIPNNLPEFLKEIPSIRTIAFNGKKAEVLFDRYFYQLRNKYDCISLKSTSPANRQFSDETMLLDWGKIF